MRKPAIHLVITGGINFLAARGYELRLHACQRHRLIAVIGDDQEDGQEAFFRPFHIKDLRFFWLVVGIHTRSDRFIGVIVVQRVGRGRLGSRLYEILRQQKSDADQANTTPQYDPGAQPARQFPPKLGHVSDYNWRDGNRRNPTSSSLCSPTTTNGGPSHIPPGRRQQFRPILRAESASGPDSAGDSSVES